MIDFYHKHAMLYVSSSLFGFFWAKSVLYEVVQRNSEVAYIIIIYHIPYSWLNLSNGYDF